MTGGDLSGPIPRRLLLATLALLWTLPALPPAQAAARPQGPEAIAVAPAEAPAEAETRSGETDGSPADPRRALEDGNRHFRAGRLEQALEAYRSGWRADHRDPVLAYNLGTTAHHLGRLPEAVLWYRRAQGASARDRWLADNLARARQALDAPRLPPPGPWSRWATHRSLVLAVGALCAWAALTWWTVRRWITGGSPGVSLERLGRRGADRGADLLAVLGALLLAFGLVVSLGAARPAVLLEACGDLPAGSEVWVRPGEDGGYRIPRPDRGSLECPGDAVAPLRP